MTNEEKQKYIDAISTKMRSIAEECDENLQFEYDVLKLALAALTAQPVKLMDCDFGAVSHMSGGSKDYCNGFVDGTQNAIKAIRAAGYQVEGE
jgi:hypothetical protein